MEDHQEKPFFLYYASPLPHLPLQAPKVLVEAYKKEFGEEEPYTGDKGYFPNQHPKATYAAMIAYLDRQLGELVAKLKALGIYDNTLIIFSSDNGPTYTGGVDYEFFESSKPFGNGHGKTKGFVYEGGIRVPMVASWPGHIAPASSTDHISAFYDVLPTLCDVVGVAPPNDVDGLSFKPVLLGGPQPEHDFLYWEFPSYKGQQAVRMGKWKGIRKNIFDGNMKVELYNLETDIGETVDVADQHPDIVRQIESIMRQEHVPAINKKFRFTELGDN